MLFQNLEKMENAWQIEMHSPDTASSY
jgi:hypothetical protein